MPSYQNFIVFLLAKANQKAQGVLKRYLKPYGLTPVQGLVLEALYNESTLTAGEIGKRLLLDNATVSGVLERLSEAGWIHKTGDTEDRRVIRVSLSQMAMDHQKMLHTDREKVSQEILAPFSHEERIILKRLLRDLYLENDR
ncbi:MarR family winged helix-turn-helix transcriptional regulator [Desulfobotulus mexicanus]|uniref:MarR family transcriptional regulator n=1 Tax=Desulfobotulus mexicanus TaxID=2586642 RepID=A0A5Q4VHF6_9BACT|nr:MarR family transcriptional regulator [Desulfobotulus mexicanus]TYT75431.1 MarR family transcriptional regulator [Desulfobotulus mexicanus]